MSHNCPKTVHSREVTNKLQSLITDSASRTKECVALLWSLQMIPRNKLDTKLKGICLFWLLIQNAIEI